MTAPRRASGCRDEHMHAAGAAEQDAVEVDDAERDVGERGQRGSQAVAMSRSPVRSILHDRLQTPRHEPPSDALL